MKAKEIGFVAIPVPDMHMAIVQDPDGNKLMIHKLKAS
jgi:hypothetical protein